MVPVLIANNLSFQRNDHDLFSGLSLSVNTGEIVHLIGENGAGKTSLIRILLGLLEPSEGQVQRDYGHEELVYVGHQLGLKELLTVGENLDWNHPHPAPLVRGADLSHQGRGEGAKNILIKNLSAGQRQRVALTRLLIKPAKIWFLDEPMTALDKQGVKWFTNLLEAHVKNGGAAIIASHHNIPVNNIHVKTLSLEKQEIVL